MHKQIFVNLPVRDLPRSMAFFSALGYQFEPQFTNESAACMIAGDNIFVMLLTEPMFQGFTPKQLCDAHRYTETLTCLACESRAQIDELVRKAVAAGGSIYNEPQDHGFMYSHGFQDPDGHIWELVHMQA